MYYFYNIMININQDVSQINVNPIVPDPILPTPPIINSDASIAPDKVKGWSWGAFILGWIWSIGNRTWIGLLTLLSDIGSMGLIMGMILGIDTTWILRFELLPGISTIGSIMRIILGIKGREWAWKNKKWESLEQFNKVQKRWNILGFILILIPIFTIIIAISLIRKSLPNDLSYSDVRSTVSSFLSEDSDVRINKPALDESVTKTLAKKAIEQIQKIKPDFSANIEDCYVNKHNTEDLWYAYVFPTTDKGFGYEVYFDNGNYTVNYDGELYDMRQNLIKKMNQLMPDNENQNNYVFFLPERIIYKTTSVSYEKNPLAYIVIADKISIDKQLDVDYELFKYTNQTLERLGKEPRGIRVAYYEGKEKISVKNDNYLFKEVDRSLTPFSVDAYYTGKGVADDKKIKLMSIGEYSIITDEKIQDMLNSKENFVEYAKSQLTKNNN